MLKIFLKFINKMISRGEYKIEFLNQDEIRMGSPYNRANISLTGGFVPDLSNAVFQNIGLVSKNGLKCYLVEWLIENASPGFVIWKVDSNSRTVIKSTRIQGICDNLEEVENHVKVYFHRWNKSIQRNIEIVEEIKFKD